MRIFLRGLTMTVVMLSTTALYAADQQVNSYVSDSDADYYGEEYAEESDDSDSYGNEGVIQQASATSHIGDDSALPMAPAGHSVRGASVTSHGSPYQAVGLRRHHHDQAHMAAPCDAGYAGCDSGCDSRSSMAQMMCGKNPQMWLQAETLLWFPQARTAPPLAVISAAGTTPLITEPTAQTFGEELGNGLSPGMRADVGRYFADGDFGIGGRFWILADDSDRLSQSSDGTDMSIGRPFFNTLLGVEDSLLVASQLAGPGSDFVGSISGHAALSMIAAEAYARINLGSGRDVHTDLIGGYSYFGIDDELSINSTSISLSVPGGGTGAERTFRDSFDTENDFHGGQIGAETIMRRGRWVARSLTKVHLGNMHQQVTIDGSAESTDILNGPRTTYDRGFLAVNQQGVYERDVFTFAPEVNLKLGYRFREHVTFSVGYSFLYWDHVALAGQQIDRLIDGDNADPANNFDPPGFRFADAGFWVQGIDLGATIEF
ncbi:MAG: BBP7 family outer membrane beta-barrel protein [Planctomycetaceae bacterium]